MGACLRDWGANLPEKLGETPLENIHIGQSENQLNCVSLCTEERKNDSLEEKKKTAETVERGGHCCAT